MVKICAVGDCMAGTQANKSERASRGVRQLALFKVPKNEENRRHWENLLQTPLQESSVVCEQHFNEEDVRTAESFIIEGCRAVLPRLRCTLRRGAMPLQRITSDEISIAEDAEENGNLAGCPDNDVPQVLQEEEEGVISRLRTILMEKPLPPTWCWFQSKENIVFCQIDPTNPKIKLYVDVQEDSSLIIRSPDNLGKADLGRKGEATAIFKFIFNIEKTIRTCNGTGVAAESRSQYCRFLISEEDYQRSTAILRCLHCRKLRHNLVRRKQQNSSSTRVQYARCKRAAYQQERQFQHLLKKVDTFEHDCVA